MPTSSFTAVVRVFDAFEGKSNSVTSRGCVALWKPKNSCVSSPCFVFGDKTDMANWDNRVSPRVCFLPPGHPAGGGKNTSDHVVGRFGEANQKMEG